MAKEKMLDQAAKLKGNVLLFYAFDIGDEIDLVKINKKKLLNIKKISNSEYFKNYHIPLSFIIPEDVEESLKLKIEGSSCISSKLHHFGALSLCYKVPFENSFEELKHKVVDIKKVFDKKSKLDAKSIYTKILPTIKKPSFYNLDNFYFAVQIDPLKDKITPEEFKEQYGEKIASLLRLEKETLSEYQKEEILGATTGYSGRDMMIIDSEASLIYDNEYFEALEFFEFATMQQLELQYFDRLLDEKLNFFYTQRSYTLPIRAYIPLLGERLNLPISLLAQLRVDISVITERLENSIKMAGDAYFSNLYSMLKEQLSMQEWHDSIIRKLDIIQDLYTVYQDRLDVIHEGILTLTIIILIALEAVLAFVR